LRFRDRVAIVTGAGSGIGEAVSLRLAQEGAHVAAADIDRTAVQETADRARTATGCDILPMEVDVSRSASVAAMVGDVLERFDHIDLLVNSAGIFIDQRVNEISEESWDRLIGVNLKGTFLCCQKVIPHLIHNGRGNIVNLGSIMGLISAPRNAAYSASKGGVVLLTKSLALEVAQHNIRVNCVCPGSIEGPMIDRYFARQPDPEAERRAIEGSYPLQRLGRLDEVVEAILFLASDAASYITGVALPVDGGFTAA
jgi:NAD(P)-dependent dehydrogenase (short-subunit alcohol dehydrogenase family)